MFGHKLKRLWIAGLFLGSVVLGLAALALFKPPSEIEISVEPNYYTNQTGQLSAKIAIPHRWRPPLIATVGTSICVTIETKDGESQEGLSGGVGISGYQADCVVPSKPWRVRFWHADQSLVRVGPYLFKLPPKTNIILTQQLPSSLEIGKAFAR